jgi:hypothetical protein
LKVTILNITFKKMILLSALTVMLGVSLIYGISLQFKPENPAKTVTTSHSVQPSGFPGTAINIAAHIIVFAYSWDAGGFVQASVVAIGPESPYYVWDNASQTGVQIANETINGTTATDMQDPLTFVVWPGVYSVFGTYANAQPQNVTVSVGEGSYGEVVFNFGSSAPPPLGHMIVYATYFNREGSSGSGFSLEYLQTSISITGLEAVNGTTSTDEWNPSIFTLAPGVYSVVATYGSATQNATATVTAGNFTIVSFDFSP